MEVHGQVVQMVSHFLILLTAVVGLITSLLNRKDLKRMRRPRDKSETRGRPQG